MAAGEPRRDWLRVGIAAHQYQHDLRQSDVEDIGDFRRTAERSDVDIWPVDSVDDADVAAALVFGKEQRRGRSVVVFFDSVVCDHDRLWLAAERSAVASEPIVVGNAIATFDRLAAAADCAAGCRHNHGRVCERLFVA